MNHDLHTVHVAAGDTHVGPHGLYLIKSGWLRWRRPLPTGELTTLRHLGTGDFLSFTLTGNDLLEALTPSTLRRVDGANRPDSAVMIASLVRQLERTQNERAMERLELSEHLHEGLAYLAQYSDSGTVQLDVQQLAESFNRDVNTVAHALRDLEARGIVRTRGASFELRR